MSKYITVQNVLEAPELCEAKVVAGSKGLSREVSAVTVAEIADISNWLQGNDFVHSVASFLDENNESHMTEDQSYRWIKALKDHGASCFAIKTKRYLKKIPDFLIQFGNSNNFPIIELPPNITQNAVTQCVLRTIWSSRIMMSKGSVDPFINLFSSLSNSKSISDICRIMSDTFNNPIMFESPELSYLGSSSDNRDISLKALLACRKPENIALVKEKIQNESHIRIQIIENQFSFFQDVQAIIQKDKIIAYISICEINDSISENDRLLLQVCLNILGIILGKYLDKYEDNMLQRGENLFQSLMAENFNIETANYYADMIGYDSKTMRIAVAVGLYHNNQAGNLTSSYMNYATDLAVHLIYEFSKESFKEVIIGKNKGYIILIIKAMANDMPLINQKTVELKNYLSENLLNEEIIIGIGRNVNGLNNYRQSIKEAIETVICQRNFNLKNISNFLDLGYYRLLLTIMKDDNNAEIYCNNILGKIISTENEETANLLITILTTYLDTGCNYVETGRILFLHANTVKYRIKQIKEKLPVDLDTLDGKCTVWLAIKIKQYKNHNEL